MNPCQIYRILVRFVLNVKKKEVTGDYYMYMVLKIQHSTEGPKGDIPVKISAKYICTCYIHV